MGECNAVDCRFNVNAIDCNSVLIRVTCPCFVFCCCDSLEYYSQTNQQWLTCNVEEWTSTYHFSVCNQL